jgi:hypothetical protein
MKPTDIFKFIFKLLLLEAFIILVLDVVYLIFRNDFDRLVLLLPIGTLLAFLMTSPFAMLIYILLRNEYGYNNKILLHATHVLIFIGVLLVFGSGAKDGDNLMVYIPSVAIIISAGIVIYMKSPKVQPDLQEQETSSINHSNPKSDKS